jgi:hypothetical protein
VLKVESRKGRQSAKNLEFPGLVVLVDGEHVARTVLSSCCSSYAIAYLLSTSMF